MAPVIGDYKDAQEAITGIDLITGERLTTGERFLSGGAAFIPFVCGSMLRGGLDLFRGAGKTQRPLTAADLGLDASKISELSGTFTISGNSAVARIDMIAGDLGNVNVTKIIDSLSETARAAGAQTLRVEGTIANEQLYNILTKRYNFISSGGTEYLEIIL